MFDQMDLTNIKILVLFGVGLWFCVTNGPVYALAAIGCTERLWTLACNYFAR